MNYSTGLKHISTLAKKYGIKVYETDLIKEKSLDEIKFGDGDRTTLTELL